MLNMNLMMFVVFQEMFEMPAVTIVAQFVIKIWQLPTFLSPLFSLFHSDMLAATPSGACCQRMGIVKPYTRWPCISLCSVTENRVFSSAIGVKMFKDGTLWGGGNKESIVVWLRSLPWSRHLCPDSALDDSETSMLRVLFVYVSVEKCLDL